MDETQAIAPGTTVTVATARQAADRAGAAPRRILLLGGTGEAVELAGLLVAAGHDVTTSLAGRTREPAPPAGAVRIGGFGGATGLAAWMADHATGLLVDATHPFARRISANAVEAARLASTPLIRLERPRWERQPGDLWTEVATLGDAAAAVPPGARVLLALGSQHLAAFDGRPDVLFVVRMVDPPAAPLTLARHEVITGKPGDLDAETDLLARIGATHIVCRNSGGPGAYAKIAAARSLGLPVIMIR